MTLAGPPRPRPAGRSLVILAIAAAALLSAHWLELSLRDLWPSPAGVDVLLQFLARAATPALSSEAEFVPPGAPSLLWGALIAAGNTVKFAAAAMALALVLGVVMGFFASTAWWAGDPAGARSPWRAWLRRTVAPLVYGGTRAVLAVLRSVHEILWAVLLLIAFGFSNAAALIAIALPFGATLGKIFAEMVDEAPRDAARALRAAGASNGAVYLLGLVPRAMPDMVSYAFYRFECALRASAVLGFFGFETLGLYLRQSFLATNYGEVWTYLYVLLLLVLVFDAWSGVLRRHLIGGGVASCRPLLGGGARALHRARPRSRFVRISVVVAAGLMLWAWWAGGFGADLAELTSERRAANLQRFAREVYPYPLRDQPWSWTAFGGWLGELWDAHGAAATAATLAISILAIAIAGVGALLLCWPASRAFVAGDGFAAVRATAAIGPLGVLTLWVARGVLIVWRAIPEYVWAFFAVAVLGPGAWAAVAALAIHNAGILGRLGAEVVENVDRRPLAPLRSIGARRPQIAVFGVWPVVLPRFLLYFFYRWETCVREATVLGTLGVVSLGYWIADARVRGQYDVLLVGIACGAVLVLAGDLLSAVARRAVR